MPHDPPEVVLRLWPCARVLTAVGDVVVHDVYAFSALPGLIGTGREEQSASRTSHKYENLVNFFPNLAFCLFCRVSQ